MSEIVFTNILYCLKLCDPIYSTALELEFFKNRHYSANCIVITYEASSDLYVTRHLKKLDETCIKSKAFQFFIEFGLLIVGEIE